MMTVSFVFLLIFLLCVPSFVVAKVMCLTGTSVENACVDVDLSDPSALDQLHALCEYVYGPSPTAAVEREEGSPSATSSTANNRLLEVCKRTVKCSLMKNNPEGTELCTEPFHTHSHTHSHTQRYHVLDAQHKSLSAQPRYRYSTHTCLGGSQAIDRSVLRTLNTLGLANHSADGLFRICKFRNVCLVYGESPTLVYFQDPQMARELPRDFQLSGFTGKDHIRLGYNSDFFELQGNKPFMPILYLNASLPREAFLHNDRFRVGFLAEHSWSNYGHILLDNILSAFAAAMQFGVPMHAVQHVFESRCANFPTFFPEDRSGIDPSETIRQHCLRHIYALNDLVFDHEPLFLDDSSRRGEALCFRTLIAGHGSALSQKAWDLSRGLSLRAFRDRAIERLTQRGLISVDNHANSEGEKDNTILVLLRGMGTSENNIDFINQFNTQLCEAVHSTVAALKSTRNHHHHLNDHDHNNSDDDIDNTFSESDYRVVCVSPAKLTLFEEIEHAHNARIIVSFHGTVAYSILYARDDTQVVLLTENKAEEYGKDFQIFSRATHFHVSWLTTDRMGDFPAVLRHAMRLLNA